MSPPTHHVAPILIALVAAFAAACGGTAPAPDPADEAPPEGMPADKDSAADQADLGKADWSLDPCDWWGWYGDGDCDGFCFKPDPDCDPGDPEQALADAAGLKVSYPLQGDTWFPESVAFDARRKRFYVGSLGQGDVSAIAADGSVTQLHPGDGDPDRVTLGMEVDSARDRLIVCTYHAPEDVTPTGRVWIFDLASGDRTHDIDLTEAADNGSCNDLVVSEGEADAAEQGDIYVTDRELPNVYRIAGTASDSGRQGGYELTLFATDPLLSKPRLGIGQNGVAITPDGKTLLTTQYLPPRLWRIDLADPTDVSEVELDGRHPLSELLAGADGMNFRGDELFVAFGGSVLRVRADDPSWRTGRFDRLDVGTKIAGLTFAGELLYVLKSDVAKFVLGGTPELPFELFAVDPRRFDD